jgi:hypothetical protein
VLTAARRAKAGACYNVLIYRRDGVLVVVPLRKA